MLGKVLYARADIPSGVQKYPKTLNRVKLIYRLSVRALSLDPYPQFAIDHLHGHYREIGSQILSHFHKNNHSAGINDQLGVFCQHIVRTWMSETTLT